MVIASRTFAGSLYVATLSLSLPACAKDVSISEEANGGVIVVTASGDRFAGAISSITYRGVQYIDVADHGRQMQSAIQLDGWGECYNPNEAGSYADGKSASSTSKLVSISDANNVLKTQTRPAFWLAPGEYRQTACNPRLASPYNSERKSLNTSKISDFVVERKTSFYGKTIPGLINVDVRWKIPGNFKSSNTEASTGYLPNTFNVFLTYDRSSRTLSRVLATAADGPDQHTALPIIIAQRDGAHSMGAFSPDLMVNPNRGYMAYFSFAEDGNPTSKWSCVYREVGIRKGSTYSYSCPIAVGTVDEVISAINAYPIPGKGLRAVIPVFRFYNKRQHFITLTYHEGAKAGYTFEGTGFHVRPTGGSDYKPLYRCFDRTSGGHSISNQRDCEGLANEGLIGFAEQNGGKNLTPLHRFHSAARDWLVTVDYDEGARNGFSYEGILGYVAR